MSARIGLLYPGSAEQRARRDPADSRLAALFEALADAGLPAEPLIYDDDWADDMRAELRGLALLLVWQNPLDARGRPRTRLDALLREAAQMGVQVSAHPDAILKLGTKDVLLATRALPFGSDCRRIARLDDLRAELEPRLLAGPRVLKQWRGHSGIGVWRVALEEEQLRLRHAQRGSSEERTDWSGLAARMAPYFEAGGHLIDQPWQDGIRRGMTRVYCVADQVAGFGQQAINALHPEAAPPGPRLYHPADTPEFQAPRTRLEGEDWIGQLCRATALARPELPLLWDADFIPRADGNGWVLCEVNVSSVAPFPDAAVAPLVAAVRARLGPG